MPEMIAVVEIFNCLKLHYLIGIAQFIVHMPVPHSAIERCHIADMWGTEILNLLYPGIF